MTKRRPAVVVLAAGRGSRFRGPGHKLEQKLDAPGDDTLRPRRCTRPSRFVVEPPFSPHTLQGRKTSARLLDSDRKASTAMT